MKNIENRFEEGEKLDRGEKLVIESLPNKRIYNPSAPFKIEENFYLFCRVEDRTNGTSEARLFQQKGNEWILVKNYPTFNLEDPFITFLNDGILFGGVDVEWKNGKVKFLRTNFYYGKDIFALDPQKPFAQGPLNMKDIRIVQLKNGLGVFTRPQGGEFLRGRICYLEIEKIEDLKNEKIFSQGRLIDLPLEDKEWVGTNDVYLLDDEHLGILAHFAFQDKDGNLHYQVITFVFNRKNFKVKSLKIIARRSDFPLGPFKEERLEDVVFPGGFWREKDYYLLYCGLSDEEIGVLKIKNPFVI